MIAGGGADVIVDWMPAALAAREAGLPLVNIAQPFKRSGMMLTCRNDFGRDLDRGLPRPDARGLVLRQRVSVPVAGCATLGIPTDGGPEGVTVLKQGFNVDPLLQKQAACISTMTYNEYWQVIDAGLTPEELTVFKYEDQGVATLEDGLYVLEERLADPAFVETMAKFVRASMKGWKWAEENPDDAAMIVLENDETGAQTEAHQKRMMGEIAKLTAGSNGTLDPADYERTVKTLLVGRLGAGDHQGARGRLDPRGHRRGAGDVTGAGPPRPGLFRREDAMAWNEAELERLRAQVRRRPGRAHARPEVRPGGGAGVQPRRAARALRRACRRS